MKIMFMKISYKKFYEAELFFVFTIFLLFHSFRLERFFSTPSSPQKQPQKLKSPTVLMLKIENIFFCFSHFLHKENENFYDSSQETLDGVVDILLEFKGKFFSMLSIAFCVSQIFNVTRMLNFKCFHE